MDKTDLGEDQDAWAKNAKDRRFWTRKRLAHLWETGWDDASFRRLLGGATADEDEDPEYMFFYKSDRLEHGHKLRLDDYGQTATWVVYTKDG